MRDHVPMYTLGGLVGTAVSVMRGGALLAILPPDEASGIVVAMNRYRLSDVRTMNELLIEPFGGDADG